MLEPLKFVSLNCEGNKHFDRILPFIQSFQPDVVCFQEVFEVDFEKFKNEFRMDGIFVPMVNLNEINRYNLAPRGRFGLMILTNHPFEDVNYTYYKGSGNDIPNFVDGEPNSVNRALVTMRVEKDGLTYTVSTTHFTWSSVGQTTPEQARDFEELSQILYKIPEIILCGDFNAPRGKEIFTRLSQKYTDNIPADVASSLDPELHRAGENLLMVDGLFTSPAYKVEKCKIVCGVSDHCAVTATIAKIEEE